MKKIKTNYGYYIKHMSDNRQSWLKHPFLVIASDDEGFLAVEFSDATGDHPYNGDVSADLSFAHYLLKTTTKASEPPSSPQWSLPNMINYHIFKVDSTTRFAPFFTKKSTCDTTKLYYFSFHDRLDVNREFDFSNTTLIATLARKVVGNIQAGHFTIYPGNLENGFPPKLKYKSQELLNQIPQYRLSNLFFNWHY